MARVQARLVEGGDHVVLELGAKELPRRDVDAQQEVLDEAGMVGPPLLGLDAGFAEHPRTERHDQPGRLGQWDEVQWRHQAALGMLPPHQGLDAQDAPVLRVHDGLVMEDELVLLEGDAQVALEGDALELAGVELGAIHDVAALALALGVHQSDVRVAQQLPGAGLSIPHHDPDARADGAVVQRTRVRPLHRLDDAPGDHLDVGAIPHPRQQYRELVPAQPGDGIGGAQATLDAHRGATQDLVADAVPHRVVDGLEVVEVEEEEGEIGAGADVPLQLTLEGAPVGDPGQSVDARHVLDLGVALHQLGPGPVEMDGHHQQSGTQDRDAGDHQAAAERSAPGPAGGHRHHPDGQRREGRRQRHPDGEAQLPQAGGTRDGIDQSGVVEHRGRAYALLATPPMTVSRPPCDRLAAESVTLGLRLPGSHIRVNKPCHDVREPRGCDGRAQRAPGRGEPSPASPPPGQRRGRRCARRSRSWC